MPESTTLLVVGGQGFIGSHLVNAGVKRGWQVSSLSLRREKFAFEFEGSEKVECLHADLVDREGLAKMLRGRAYDHVINGGGYIDHQLFGKGGRSVYDQHFGGLLNLVENLNREKLKAFVQIGSSDEYGGGVSPQSESLREAPISPYSAAKAAASHFLQMLHVSEAFPAVVARIFLTYGPGQDEKRFIPQIIRGCLENREFPTSKGIQLRDFCYVEDIVEGIFKILQTPAALGQVYNLASGRGVTIRSMLEKIVGITGSGRPDFGKVAYRPGENMELVADVGKAVRELAWNPPTTLDDGLRRTIGYYRELWKK